MDVEGLADLLRLTVQAGVKRFHWFCPPPTPHREREREREREGGG